MATGMATGMAKGMGRRGPTSPIGRRSPR